MSSRANPFSPCILPAAEVFVLVAKPPVLEVGCATEAGNVTDWVAHRGVYTAISACDDSSVPLTMSWFFVATALVVIAKTGVVTAKVEV
jgi:hypothetical protein